MDPVGQLSCGEFVNITPEELLSHLPAARVVDVREPSEFSGPLGHIPGAELAPLAQLTVRAAAWPKEHPVILVCRSGTRSARGAAELAQNGFRHVLNLRGGMEAYVAAWLPIERGP